MSVAVVISDHGMSLTDCCALVAGCVFADLLFELFDNLFGVVDDLVGFLALGFEFGDSGKGV